MPRSKKKRRSVKDRITIDYIDVKDKLWIVKNFLVAAEKRALINYYRDRIDKLMNDPKDEDAKLDSEVERNLKVFSSRIEFITRHF